MAIQGLNNQMIEGKAITVKSADTDAEYGAWSALGCLGNTGYLCTTWCVHRKLVSAVPW